MDETVDVSFIFSIKDEIYIITLYNFKNNFYYYAV